ncbi:MAG: penicillin-binding protein 2 [Verrucomicrobia bacterium]|nr:penicillin-binding protein 2 [Verrucomicrobiota bacterium]
MIRAIHRWQATLVAVVLLSGFSAIGWRLVDLQVTKHEWLAGEADKERMRTYVVEGRRGRILGAGGEILAISLAKKIVAADPMLLSSLDLPAPVAPAIIRKTAEVLGMDERAIWAKLGRDTHYVVLAHKVDEAVYSRLTNEIYRLDFGLDPKKLPRRQANKLAEARRNAIYAYYKDEFERIYPNGPLASHVLGYLVNARTNVLGYITDDYIGANGIERQFERSLRGYDGMLVTEKDARGQPLPQYEKQNILPHDGCDVQLTLNQLVQGALEEELDKAMAQRRPDSVVGIVMRPGTGEVLAMAVRPGFDPNAPNKIFAGCRTPQERAAVMNALRNRCLADIAEPGSTFKIVTIAGALNEHAVVLEDSFNCATPFVYCSVPLHDAHHYGVLSVLQIITKSSNIGAARVGIRLGTERLYRYMRAFGFGQKTGIELPGEVSGIVHKPNVWSAISIAHIPMGHEVAVTPLQMCAAMSAIANGGRLMKPTIVSALINKEGQVVERFQPTLVKQVITPDAAAQMMEALTTVTQKGGTGTDAAVPGFDVAGKTGTAQKIDGGKYEQKYYSSFVGFLPARKPELCILISMDNPNDPDGAYFGGKVAAPVFRAVAEKAAKFLSIPPDHPVNEIASQPASANSNTSRLASSPHATQ